MPYTCSWFMVYNSLFKVISWNIAQIFNGNFILVLSQPYRWMIFSMSVLLIIVSFSDAVWDIALFPLCCKSMCIVFWKQLPSTLVLTLITFLLIAIGQIMLYVDGMNGVINHSDTIQWLYSLTASRVSCIIGCY